MFNQPYRFQVAARGLRRESAAARLLGWRARIPPAGAWMSVSYDCCVSSDRGLCVRLITRQEESYRPWCVVVCDLEISGTRRPWPTGGGGALASKGKKNPHGDCQRRVCYMRRATNLLLSPNAAAIYHPVYLTHKIIYS